MSELYTVQVFMRVGGERWVDICRSHNNEPYTFATICEATAFRQKWYKSKEYDLSKYRIGRVGGRPLNYEQKVEILDLADSEAVDKVAQDHVEGRAVA